MSDRTVLVTGGAGYVGSALVPHLLDLGYRVRVLDLFLYGDDVLDGSSGEERLERVRGDIRDLPLVRRAVSGCYAVIHLACISNDPSFELDPELGRSINFDAFEPLVCAARDAGVSRFIYASSSSVYGLKPDQDVTEDASLEPLTDYSKYKAMCEDRLRPYQSPDFTTVIVRPATICGYAPRQRFDLTVNILTNHAVNRRTITVFGGAQLRPNLHISDMVALYAQLLAEPEERVAGKTFNAGFQNRSVSDIAGIVRDVVSREMPDGEPIGIVTQPTDDLRSYHISSGYLRRELGFEPCHTIEDAVSDLCAAFRARRFRDPLTNPLYVNIKRMQELALH